MQDQDISFLEELNFSSSDVDSLMNLNLNMSEEELLNAFLPSHEANQRSPPALDPNMNNVSSPSNFSIEGNFELEDDSFKSLPGTVLSDQDDSSGVEVVEIEEVSQQQNKRKSASSPLPKRLTKKIKQEPLSPSYINPTSPKNGDKKPDEKVRRLESNKRSAQASRERKKQLKTELEAQVSRLVSENKDLQSSITELEAENKILKSEFNHLQGLVSNSPLFSKFQSMATSSQQPNIPLDQSALNPPNRILINPFAFVMAFLYLNSLNTLPGRSIYNLSNSTNNNTTTQVA